MSGPLWRISIVLSTLLFLPRAERLELLSGGGYDGWRNAVVYQLLTDRFARSDGSSAPCADWDDYCGGTWQGIVDHLDYIKGLGVDAIWISPVMKAAPKNYHGYAAVSLSAVNPHFGTEQDLHTLVNECHKRGILVMVDVVANHMGSQWSDIPSIEPFNNTSFFHNCDRCHQAGGGAGGRGCDGSVCDCWVDDYNNVNQELYCQLFGLPDLDQDNPFVRDKLLTWVKGMVQKYGFDGLRLDTVPYVKSEFWKEFTEASGVFSLAEVSTPDDTKCEPYISSGAVGATINYPLFYSLISAFMDKQSLQKLSGHISYQRKLYGDSKIGLLGLFAENHDVERLPYRQGDVQLRKAMILYTLTAEGLGSVYYGMEQDYRGAKDPPASSEREPLWTSKYRTSDAANGMYDFIASVNALRHRMPAQDFRHATQYERYVLDNFYVFMRGQIVVALTNGGAHAGRIQQTVPMLPWKKGTKVCNVFWPKDDCMTVSEDYHLTIILDGGESKLFAPEEYMPKTEHMTLV
jgi:alpha-amylase